MFVKQLDLLLVNPGNRFQSYGRLGNVLAGVEPPIWCALLAAFIRERGYSVEIMDADVEGWTAEYTAEMIGKHNPLLAAIIVLGTNPSASSTPKMPAVREILTLLRKKKPEIRTLLGGLHPSALPERTLREENPDFVCQGEGFYTLLSLLEALKSYKKLNENRIAGLWYMRNKEVAFNPMAPLIKKLDDLPIAAWDLLPMQKYRAHNWHCFNCLNQRQSYAVIFTSLGCPFSCTYCNIHALYNGKPGIRLRSIKKVIEEIDLLVEDYKVKNIKILDELFVLNEERVMEFCELLILRRYDLNMWAYARIDTVNEKMLKMMKKAGVNWLAYGIESGSKKVRQSVTKGRLADDMIKTVVDMTHKAGIHIVANFIFGLPEDNLETMQETLELAKELNCEYANFYTAMAYPGSSLYKYALDSKMKLPNNWISYAQLSKETLPLATKYLSNAEILRFRDKAFYDYHSSPKYLNMMRDRFGEEVVEYIKNMCKYKIDRKFA